MDAATSNIVMADAMVSNVSTLIGVVWDCNDSCCH